MRFTVNSCICQCYVAWLFTSSCAGEIGCRPRKMYFKTCTSKPSSYVFDVSPSRTANTAFFLFADQFAKCAYSPTEPHVFTMSSTEAFWTSLMVSVFHWPLLAFFLMLARHFGHLGVCAQRKQKGCFYVPRRLFRLPTDLTAVVAFCRSWTWR